MVQDKQSLLVGGLGAILLCATFAAQAQDSNTVIGPPQLKDFSLRPRNGLPDQSAEPAPMVRRNVPVQLPPSTTTKAPTRPAAPPRMTPAPAPVQPRAARIVQAPSASAGMPEQSTPLPAATAPADIEFAAPETAPPGPSPS